MPQNHLVSTYKKFHSSHLFSYVNKQKKLFLAIALTPLLAACDFSLVGSVTEDDGNNNGGNSSGSTVPSNSQLFAQNFTVHRSNDFSDDNYSGSSGKDAIVGANGDDTLKGNGGGDLIYGQAGDDILDGGDGADDVYGGSGDDYIIMNADGDYDYTDGGSGSDTATFKDIAQEVTVDLASGEIEFNNTYEDKIINIENIDGATNAINSISGNGEINLISGGTLADYLSGAGGNDILEGLAGDDELHGGDGNDELHGGEGKDKLYGDNGADTLYGNNGHDELNGGAGDDLLKGGDGDDLLIGGTGEDEFYGGAGADTFKFTNADVSGDVTIDVIKDFTDGEDFIDFSGLNYIDDFSEVDFNMVQRVAGVDIVIDADDYYIVRIEGITTAQLSDADFLFA